MRRSGRKTTLGQRLETRGPTDPNESLHTTFALVRAELAAVRADARAQAFAECAAVCETASEGIVVIRDCVLRLDGQQFRFATGTRDADEYTKIMSARQDEAKECARAIRALGPKEATDAAE